jgi:hypothetical protein
MIRCRQQIGGTATARRRHGDRAALRDYMHVDDISTALQRGLAGWSPQLLLRS